MIWPKTKGSRYGLNCCQSIKNWSQSILDANSFQSISGGAPTGTTSNPTPMLLPMIGKNVHGLLVNAPASTATRLNRNAQAQNSAVRAAAGAVWGGGAVAGSAGRPPPLGA